mgnify:CR=1 FL=1
MQEGIVWEAILSYQLEDLLYLMTRLRHPQHGCPWDIAQDFHSIVPHTLEEAYEVADAIERNDMAQLPSELGDLLFQVVYYSQLAQEEERFNFYDVINTLMAKMIRRHPHVFPEGNLYAEHGVTASQAEINEQWEAIKATEKSEAPSPLDDIPLNLPGLTRAYKIQKKASRLGFDWQQLAPVVTKLDEEIAELKEAITHGAHEEIMHELGDVLFCAVNVARHLHIDPEQAIRRANQRFSQRFNYVAQQVEARGKTIKNTDPEQLDLFWNQAKQQ